MLPDMHDFNEDKECFSLEEVQQTLKKMHNGKAGDAHGIYTERIEWLPQKGLTYVTNILNQAYRYGFPFDWQDNCIKALYKGGDKNELSNYRTIMLGPIMAKLFGGLLESQLNTWAEKTQKGPKGKLALGRILV